MTTFKVTANKLNLRSSPVSDFKNKGNIVGTLRKDALFKSIHTVENELGTWQVGIDGQVVSDRWLINTMDFPSDHEGEQSLQQQIETYIDAVKGEIGEELFAGFEEKRMNVVHKKLLIPYLWKAMNTRGEGVNIAVIDSGIDKNHPDLQENVHEKGSKSFIEGDNEQDFIDYSGHGTCCAGLIAGAGKSDIFGIAPKSNLFSLKIFDGIGFKAKQDKEKTLLEVSEWIRQLDKSEDTKIDIISMSVSIDENFSKWEQALKELSKTKLIVAAANNKGNNNTRPGYPSDYDFVLSVGSLDNDFSVLRNCRLSPNLKFATFGDNLSTTKLTLSSAPFKTTFSDTSASTAVIAGILALFVSRRKNNNLSVTNAQIVQTLLENSFKKEVQKDASVQTLYFPFPLRAFNAKMF